MKSITTLTLSALSLLWITGCNPPAENHEMDDHHHEHEEMDMDAVKMEIQEIENKLAEAQNNKDVDAALALYSDDIISYPPNKEPYKGKSNLRTHMEEWKEDTTGTTVSFEVIDVMAEGDLLVETGKWRVKNEAGEESAKGKYVAVYKKEDGKYHIVREIWNSSFPTKKMEKAEG